MSESAGRRTEEGFRRVIAFADAVVAIALTLLVLPLTDAAGDLAEERTLWEVLDHHSDTVISFLISFAVIWVLWRHHHRVMENFRAYDGVLLNLHFAWLLTIVVLPFVTALLANEKIRWSVAAYILVLAVSVASLMGMARRGHARPELVVDDEVSRQELGDFAGIGTLVTLAVAFIISIVAPEVGSWVLLLLMLTAPVEAGLRRIRRLA